MTNGGRLTQNAASTSGPVAASLVGPQQIAMVIVASTRVPRIKRHGRRSTIVCKGPSTGLYRSDHLCLQVPLLLTLQLA